MTILETALARLELDAFTTEPSGNAVLIGALSPGDAEQNVPVGEPFESMLVAADALSLDLNLLSFEFFVQGVLRVAVSAGNFVSVEPTAWQIVPTLDGNAVALAMTWIAIDANETLGSEALITCRIRASYDAGPVTDTTWTFRIADVTPINVVGAVATGTRTVRVAFDDTVALQGNASFAVTGVEDGSPKAAVTVLSAVADGTSVTLTLSTDTSFGAAYRVTASGVTDESGNGLGTASADFVSYRPAWPATRRFRVWDMLPMQSRVDDASGDLRRFSDCLQDVVDLILLRIDEWPQIFDLTRAPEAWLDQILVDLGNPFRFSLSLQEKRKLASALVALYRLKGTEPGLIQAVRFLLDMEISVTSAGGALMRLGVSKLGLDWILGAGDARQRRTFLVNVPVALTSEQRARLLAIVRYMKPVNTHLGAILEPEPPDQTPDHWELGRSLLGTETILHGVDLPGGFASLGGSALVAAAIASGLVTSTQVVAYLGGGGAAAAGIGSGSVQMLPPQLDFLRAHLDAFQGVTDTGGEASSWSSLAPANLTVTGAVTERPDIVTGTYPNKLLRFNGSSDRLTFTALEALGSKATFGAWVKVASTISVNDTLFSSGGLGGGYLDLGTFINERWIASVAGATAGTMNGTADGTVKPGVWQFVAVVFDGTQAAQNDRLKIYLLEHGESVPTLQGQIAGGTIPDSITAGAGTGAIGDLVGFSRQLPMDLAETMLWKGAALTPSELVSAARTHDPLAGKATVMALGDSITLGVGDENVDGGSTSLGGYRGRLLEFAGDNEAFWFHGPIRDGVKVNNRCSAVGGSRIDEHLTQWNTAIAAGAAPEYVLYMGGRNDLTQGASQATINARWVALFDAISANPKVKRIIVSTIVPESTNGAATVTANAALVTICAAYPKITLVDGYAALNYATDLFDAVHPNPTGYWKLARLYYDALRTFITTLPAPNPPRLGSMPLWLDPTQGIASTGGVVDSWTSRVGSAVFNASGSARPTLGAGYIEFDGVDDKLSRSATSESHPASATKATLAMWMRRDTNGTLHVWYSSVSYFIGDAGFMVQDNANASRQYYMSGGTNEAFASALAIGTWWFRAIVFDGSQPAGSRITIYEGQDANSVAVASGVESGTNAAFGVAAGESTIGADGSLGRFADGRVSHIGMWNVPLTLAEARAFAALTQPF